MASNGPEKKADAEKMVSSTVRSGENSADDVNYQDLTQFMQTFFQQMEEKFQASSDQILGKIDLMSQRIDELEKNIAELSTQAAMDERPPLPPSTNA